MKCEYNPTKCSEDIINTNFLGSDRESSFWFKNSLGFPVISFSLHWTYMYISGYTAETVDFFSMVAVIRLICIAKHILRL